MVVLTWSRYEVDFWSQHGHSGAEILPEWWRAGQNPWTISRYTQDNSLYTVIFEYKPGAITSREWLWFGRKGDVLGRGSNESWCLRGEYPSLSRFIIISILIFMDSNWILISRDCKVNLWTVELHGLWKASRERRYSMYLPTSHTLIELCTYDWYNYVCNYLKLTMHSCCLSDI